MKRNGVRPSLRPSMGPQQQTRCCMRYFAAGLMLWARWAEEIDRLPHDRHRANAGSATLSAYVR